MENQLRFFEWMLAIGNIHLANNERMARAFERIAESDTVVSKTN